MKTDHGFSLVEVTIAMGVAVVSLISLLGLLPIGISNNHTSISQTSAACLGRMILADLQSTPVTKPATEQKSPLINIPFPCTGTPIHTVFFSDDGTPIGTVDSDATPSTDRSLSPHFRATLFFTNATDASQKNATKVRILITWPALADKAASALPNHYTGSFELVSAFNRN
jgi:uncharacterized protein (TIGR02598 family)